jgi:hypothetical protein
VPLSPHEASDAQSAAASIEVVNRMCAYDRSAT